MIKFINKISGGDMWVHESRVEEYLAAGYQLAAPPQPEHPLIKTDEPAKPVRKPAAKKTTKAR